MNIYFQKTHQRAFGTFPLRGSKLISALEAAVEVGYRAIDTAQMYENETEVGECLANCNIKRGELCITTKVHPDNFEESKFLNSVEQSLKNLRVDYVDALLLHWPPMDGVITPSIKLLQTAMDKGLTRNIGVSNYTAQMMREAKEISTHPLITNQVEFHPLLNQDTLLAATTETGIPLSSYSSVARGEVFKHSEFAEIGEVYSKTAGQVVLRWILQKGVSVNTMSTNPTNIEANFDIMDFTLSSVDMARIDVLTNTNFRIVGSDLVPWAPEWD